jgi:DNA-directed RNA polymerase subunit M/transcription elongation factor TFIIS
VWRLGSQLPKINVCPECGGKLVLAQTDDEGVYEVVCTVCGLVVDVTDRYAYASEMDPDNPQFKFKHEKAVFCKVCGQQISWNGKGRKPKYCKQCAKEMKRLNNIKWYHNNLGKKSLTKNDIFLVAIQKRAS